MFAFVNDESCVQIPKAKRVRFKIIKYTEIFKKHSMLMKKQAFLKQGLALLLQERCDTSHIGSTRKIKQKCTHWNWFSGIVKVLIFLPPIDFTVDWWTLIICVALFRCLLSFLAPCFPSSSFWSVYDAPCSMQHADSEQAAVPPFDVRLLSAFPALQSVGTATVDSIRYSLWVVCLHHFTFC